MAKSKMETLIQELSKKIDSQYVEVDRRLDNIEKVMIVQEINLKTHIQRSDRLEAIIDHLKEKEIAPLTIHKNRVEGALKLIGIVSLLVGIAVGIVSLFKAI